MATRASEGVDLEWTSVSKKRSNGKTSSVSNAKLLAKGHAALGTTSLESKSPEAVANAIDSGKRLVVASTYYNFLLQSILGAHNSTFESIIAFGLGNLTSETSKLQLILYLCLCDSLLAESAAEYNKSIYDPCISDFDRKVLELLKVPVLTENSKGKHEISRTTLFYLPHCPYRLYCNLLWANWDCFDKMYILGNRYRMIILSILWFYNGLTFKLPLSPPTTSFQSYNIRRLEFNTTTTLGAGGNKTKRSNKKATATVATAVAPVGATDTVALLTPFIVEVDMWPATTHNLTSLPIVAQEDTSCSMALSSGGSSVPAENGVVPTPPLDRSVFLKEAKTNPALRYLENAMCDMRYATAAFAAFFLITLIRVNIFYF